MRFVIIIFGLTFCTSAVAMDPALERPLAALDAAIDRAQKQYLAQTDRLIDAAERSGEVARAIALREARDAAWTERFAPPKIEVPVANAEGGITVTEQHLARWFNADRALVAPTGEVQLMYSFRNPASARDFAYNLEDVALRNALQLGAKVDATHKAQWTGNLRIQVEMAHANWASDYLKVGSTVIKGSTYNAWFVWLDRSKANVDGRYNVTGNINQFRPADLQITPERKQLIFDRFEGQPVTVGADGGKVFKDQLVLHGGDGGAAIRNLIITGTLDPAWVALQAQQ